MNVTVRDVMTASVVAVRGDTSFKDLAALLGSFRVSAFPVVDETDRVLGVVSEADMLIKEADQPSHLGLFAGLRRPGDHESAAAVTAGELMTRCPVSPACTAIAAVSGSRISPTMTTCGSCRIMLLSATA